MTAAVMQCLPSSAEAAQRLAAFKVPVKVIFWPETLPRNANGKLLKRQLRENHPQTPPAAQA